MSRWRHLVVAVAWAALAMVLWGPAYGQNQPHFVPNRILVQFRPETTLPQIRNLLAAARARNTWEIPHTGVRVVILPADADEEALANAFNNRPEVASAEVDQIVEPSIEPNDPWYANAWHLPRIAGP